MLEHSGGVRGLARCRDKEMRESRALQVDPEDERTSGDAHDDKVQTDRDAGPEVNLEKGLPQKSSSVRRGVENGNLKSL